jgi:hypothetical protein
VKVDNLSDKRKIGSAELRFLRSLAGYNLLDFRRNTCICYQLNIRSPNDDILKQKNNRYEHVIGMDENVLPTRKNQ